ncbi:MAG TPA: hypothetical protein VF851_11115 [Steroidobacteraceae bacterium]
MPPPGWGFLVRPLLLLVIAVVAAAFWHWRQPRFWRACWLAMLTSTVLFYVVALSGFVYRAPFIMRFEYFWMAVVLRTQMLVAFWLAVLVSTLGGSFLIAAGVGWWVRRRRQAVGDTVPVRGPQ